MRGHPNHTSRDKLSGASLFVVLTLTLLVWPGSRARADEIAPPVNDLLSNALVVAGEAFEINADLGAAGRELHEPAGVGNFGQTAWWSWTSEADGIMEWDSADSSNLVALAIFERDAFGQLHKVGETYRRAVAHDETWSLVPDRFGSFQTRAGQSYLIQADLTRVAPRGFVLPPPIPGAGPWGPVESRAISAHLSRLAATAPDNDLFANRIPLSGEVAGFQAELNAATLEPGEPRISGSTLGRTLWWTWTAPAHGSATIESLTGDAPPVVGIYYRGTAQTLGLVASSVTDYGNQCFTYETAKKKIKWDVVAGGVYEIQVDRHPTYDAHLSASFQLTLVTAPVNDVPEGAAELTGNDLSLTASVVAATRRPNEPVINTQSGANSVWYRWQAPGAGVLQVTRDEPLRYDDPSYVSNPDGSVVIEIHRGFCLEPPVDLFPTPPFVPVFGLFERGSFDGGQTMYWYEASRGTNGFISNVQGPFEYHIAVDGADGSPEETPMNLLFTPPPQNDSFGSRIVLPAAPVQVMGRTFAATRELADPAYYKNGVRLNRSVWWQWSAPAAGRWALVVEHGGFHENKFVVFRGGAAAISTEVASTEHEPVVFEASAGEAFQIGVFAQTQFGMGIRFLLTPVVSPPPVRAALHSNSFLLRIPGNSGLPYVVEQSPDLRQWVPVQTNSNPWPHWIYLPFGPHMPAEFFRTRLQDETLP
jgi:hypothetical protein